MSRRKFAPQVDGLEDRIALSGDVPPPDTTPPAETTPPKPLPGTPGDIPPLDPPPINPAAPVGPA